MSNVVHWPDRESWQRMDAAEPQRLSIAFLGQTLAASSASRLHPVLPEGKLLARPLAGPSVYLDRFFLLMDMFVH